MTPALVVPGLFMSDRGIEFGHVDVLILCATEHQPSDDVLPGVIVIRAPFIDDGPLSHDDRLIALNASEKAAAHLEQQRKVLISCVAGLNRSGLVTALTLRRRGRLAREAIALVRAARGPAALSNEWFEALALRAVL